MNKYLEIIERSFQDKEFVAKLLHDAIPEYQDVDVDFIAENYVLDEEADIRCMTDKNGKICKVVVNFNAMAPDADGYIGFTVNFVI